MLKALLILSAAAVALAANLPEPGELALKLNEEQFEDYLDTWLAAEEPKWVNASSEPARNGGCTIRVNGDLGQPQPAFLRNGRWLEPSGNSGQIHLNAGDEVRVGCSGSGRTIRHPNIASTVSFASARCVSNNLVSGAGWLNGNGAFGGLTCSTHAYHDAIATGRTCYNGNTEIQVGFVVDNVFYTKFWSCFDRQRLEVLYTWAPQDPPNAVHQTGVDRPSWLAGNWYPGMVANTQYTQVTQKATIAGYVGQALADRYVTNTQFLARGHLVAKTDMIYATGQRATFWFINAAPQWQPFNAGNWNWLEQNLRERIGAAGYNTMVYTGTFGVSQLRNQNNQLVDIYLGPNSNNRQLPVPLYFYKVVYDAGRRLGTAFVSINNPYYTAAEARALTFCTDRCRNNSAFSWLRWQPDRIDIGYSFCCTVDDFRRTVPHLPAFQNLRERIGAAGYNTMVYTGTFGVSQLRNQNNQLVDIYLGPNSNNRQLPVPLYFYKVVYDAGRRLGTAFVSINNPYYTAAEARALTFCTDRCRNNSAFSWLRWQPDRIDIGYSFCCTVDDFRRTVPHLPAFQVNGLLS